MVNDAVILVYNTGASKDLAASIFMAGRQECRCMGPHIPEVMNLHQRRFENLKSCKIMLLQYSEILRKFRTDLLGLIRCAKLDVLIPS